MQQQKCQPHLSQSIDYRTDIAGMYDWIVIIRNRFYGTNSNTTSELGVRKYIFYLVNNSFILYDGIKEIYFIDLIIFTWKKLQMEDQVINNYQTSTEIIRC